MNTNNGWLDIASAPKDELILVGPTKRMGICVAMNSSEDGWVTETINEWHSMYTPTHWMPLPAAPGSPKAITCTEERPCLPCYLDQGECTTPPASAQDDAKDATPAARWRDKGEPDPHAGRYDVERAALPMGKLSDDELANGVFMHYNAPLNLQGIMAGTHSSPIAWATAAKDRIRWLSRKLEEAQAAPAAGDARALLDHPLLRDVLGYIEDAGPADVWGAAQSWMALRDAASQQQEG